jgi:3-methyl-2-oxobutanoate hydroxymethyltransferase
MYKSDDGGGGTQGQGTARRKKVTAPALRAQKGGQPITMVTAYDYTMARLLDDAGVDALLVGDSLGMVVQGHSSTIPVSLEEIAYHCRAVARGAASAHVVGDMPFMSYQISPEQALTSAGRLIKEGAAESVKLEGGEEVAEHVMRIVRAGIPVMGHIGLTPQSVHALGGYRVQGKDDDAVNKLVADARALEQAGVFAIVLEAMPPDAADEVTQAVSVPTIGIGAGVGCDGQVLVCYDLLGMTFGHTPRFAKRFAELGTGVREAAAAFVRDVHNRDFPGPENSYPSTRKRKAKLAVVRR